MTVNSQEFEETLKKIRNNATGDEVSFWDTGLDEEDCARLCEALKVAIQSNKRDTALSLAHALTLFGWPAYPLCLVSADYRLHIALFGCTIYFSCVLSRVSTPR